MKGSERVTKGELVKLLKPYSDDVKVGIGFVDDNEFWGINYNILEVTEGANQVGIFIKMSKQN